MTHEWRRRFFYSLIVVFLTLGGGTLFYAQGWRLDTEDFSLKKVGGIYVKSVPHDAAIFLDGEPIKKNRTIFQAGTLINDLLPRTYILSLSRDGYKPWERHIGVHPSIVSEVGFAVLVPSAAAPVMRSNDAGEFWILDHEPLVKNTRGELTYGAFTLRGAEVVSVREETRAVLTRDNGGNLFINELERSTSTNITAAIRRTNPSFPRNAAILLDPQSAEKLFIATPEAVSLFDLKKNTMTLIATSTDPIVEVASSRLFFAWATFDEKKNASTLWLFDRAANVRKNGGRLLAGKTTKLAWRDEYALGILEDDGGLYLLSLPDEIPDKTASAVRDFAFSYDGKALAALEERALEVFSPERQEEYRRFNVPDAAQIERFFWYRDRKHLFFSYPDRVVFFDLDDLSQENIIEVAETGESAYDPKSNRFYFLEDGSLYRIDFPN